MSELIENYLKDSKDGKPHLRLLAIIKLYNDTTETNCFGVFVGCKGSTTGDTGDSEFPIGKLIYDNSPTRKPKWQSKRPLWVIPLMETENPEKPYEITYEKVLQKEYICSRAAIKFFNKFNEVNHKIHDWKDYCYLPNKDSKSQELIIPSNSFKFDIKLGSFHTLSEKSAVGTAITNLPFWVSDKQNLNENPNHKSLLTFEGIVSEIISTKTSNKVYYPEFTGFFAVGERNDGFWPVFSITPMDSIWGGDVPIRWHKEGWLDDLLTFNIIDEFKIILKNDYSPHDDSNIVKKIFDKVITIPTSWLGRKENEENIFLFIADKKTITGELKEILSPNYLSYLNNYLFYFFENEIENRIIICDITNTSHLTTTWNNNALEQSKAILKNKGAQPIGIVPQIKNATGLSSIAIKYENVNGNYADFSKVYFPESPQADISFPLIQNDGFLTNQNRINALETPKIQLENVKLNSSEKNISDNGSIIILQISAKDDYDLTHFKFLDGSFSFKLNKYEIGEIIIDELQISLQLQKAQRPLFLWQWHKGIDEEGKEEDFIEFCYSINKFRIPVREINAFGNDLIGKEKLMAPSSVGAITEGFGERSEPTLVVPILGKKPESNGDETSKYYLNLSESSNVAQDYRLEMQLEEKGPEGGIDSTTKVEAIVLNATPQQIAKVQTDFLRSPKTDDGVYILARKSNFSIDSGTWEIYTDKALEEGFLLTLPSQAIGEAYVKSNNNNTGEPEDKKIIDCRFSPTAVLQIANEQLDRHYVTPPWNLKNIWGEIGSSPGLQLIKAQFELLYGLSAVLENKEAYIAELALKLGTITNPPQNNIVWEASKDQKDAFTDLYKKYIKLYRAWQSRLSILEVSSTDKFKPTKFTEGINYFIRKEENKFIDGKIIEEGAQLKWPIGNQVSPSEINKKYHNKDGLAGGAFYPFESLGVYEELWREGLKKGSSSGEIENLSFTSLGGYGKQTARFSGDKTVIKSTTSLGKTHFHAVERIGRIGVFWNKAKHVIEYERTVVPSLQFKDDQPPLPGRPIVRKVREYIEILEPTRNFPDLDSSYFQSAGSIVACKFKSIKIPVASSWGRNVIGKKKIDNKDVDVLVGWEIPLWNKHANQEIYPFPQILLELLATKTSDIDTVLTQIENVEDIYFYTDVRSEIEYADDKTGVVKKSIIIDAHTDNWPTVKYIDYTDLPMVDLNKGTKPALGNTPELMDAILPAPLTILPGFERFSFKVKPSEVTSSVNGRYIENSEINGKLRVATMMRSNSNGMKPITSLPPDSDTLITILNEIAFKGDNLLTKFTNGFEETNAKLVSGNVPKTIDSFVLEIHGKFSSLQNQIGDIKNGLCKDPILKYLLPENVWTLTPPSPPPTEAPINFELPTKLLWKKTIESTDSFIGNIITNYDLLIAEATKLIVEEIQQADIAATNFIDNLYSGIDGRIISVQKIIEQFSFEIRSVATEAIELINFRKDTIIDTLSNQINNTVSDEKGKIQNIKFTTIDEAKEKVKLLLDEGENAIITQINSNNLLKKLNSKFLIGDKIAALVKDVKDKIDSVTALGEIKEKAKEYVDELHNEIVIFIAEIRGRVDEIQSIIDEEATKIKEAIETIEKEIAAQLKEISKLISCEGFKIKLKEFYLLYKDQKNKFQEEFEKAWKVLTDDTKKVIVQTLATFLTGILIKPDANLNSLYDYFKVVDDYIKGIIKGFSSFFNNIIPANFKTELEKYLHGYDNYENLKKVIATGDPKQILEQANKLAEEINNDLGDFTGTLLNTYTQGQMASHSYNELNDSINNTLFNYRSVYDELIAPGLGFNRRTVAMLVNTDWKNVEQRLTITPVITRFNQLQENLSALGIRLPSVSITDKFLAPAKEWGKEAEAYFEESFLKKFDFTNILKGAGGINLERLIPGFKMPDEFRNNFKITHGTDKQNLKAWAKAESNITIAERKQLFAIGPVNVSLEAQASLIGNVKAEINADSKLTKENYGELKGSFIIGLQSTELMRFRDAKVTCINDKYDFDLDPSRIEMSGLLKLISDATKNIPVESEGEGEDSSVFKIAILKEKFKGTDIEIPYGVNASLDIPPITIGGGPTNITNLAFGGNFKMIAFDIEKKKLDFKLGLGFYMGKREAPFVFTAFIFGGGGFIDCSLAYAPSVSSSLDVEFAMSVQASAALAFNGGWIYGSVMVGMGIEVVYIKKAFGPGSSTSLIMFIQFIGHVCVVRIIHLFLVVRLAIAYDGQKMSGTGRIKASMRICRFFTLKVEKDYNHDF